MKMNFQISPSEPDKQKEKIGLLRNQLIHGN